MLQEENVKLKKAIESLDGEKQLLQERVLRLERSLAQPRRQDRPKRGDDNSSDTPSF
jgi:hypothetical protein